MTIANVTRAIELADDSDFLGLPVMHHISEQGYWYTYHPSDYDSNATLSGNSISIYEWDSLSPISSADQLSGNSSRIELDGTAAFIDESHGNGTLRYHGGCVVHIGSGVNDITNVNEANAFFMAHIGTWGDDGPATGGLLEDDAFYWDRFYQQSAGGDWNYYQYHKHLPSNYPRFDDGRIVFAADDYIRPADKQYGYLISVRASTGGKSYNVPLARIHTPSIGGAHNSHNDVTLPNTSGVNFVNGGIISGGSNRFHASYLDSNGSGNWNFYTRTYTSSSGSFTPEVSYGSFDLADPVNTPYAGGDAQAEGSVSEYPMRMSAGHSFGSKVYWPVLMNSVYKSFDVTLYGDVIQNLYRVGGEHRDDPNKLNATDPSTGDQNPTIYLKVGDTIVFDASQSYQNHPMYVKSSLVNALNTSQNVASGTSGNGTATITWDTTGLTPGEYYYVCVVHNGMYGKIILEASNNCVDAQIWSVTDANTISPGTLSRTDLPWRFTGRDDKPDILITSVGDKLYIAGGSARDGGLHLYSAEAIDSTGSFYDEGKIISTDSENPARLHGFKYNATNTKFYALASADGQSNFKGLYSFDLAGGTFDGYEHLKWNDSGYFEDIGAATSGYIEYTHSNAQYTAKSTIEPEGIPNGSSILRWDVSSPQFFNRKEINTNSEEYLFQGIYLKDGRKALVGRIEGHVGNTGTDNTGDLLLTIVDNEGESISYSWGGTGDDFITGIIEDEENDRLVISGYAKGELGSKSNQWVHGWARRLRNTDNTAGITFTGIDIDQYGHYSLSANDNLNGDALLTCYNKNFDYQTTVAMSLGGESDNFSGVLTTADNKRVVVGGTKNLTSEKSAFVMNVDSDFTTVNWAKGFSSSTNYLTITDHCLIQSSGTEYAICFAQINTTVDQEDYQKEGVLFGVNTSNGSIIFQKSISGLASSPSTMRWVSSIAPGAPNTGTFFIAGSSGIELSGPTRVYKTPFFAYGDINTSDVINYIEDKWGSNETSYQLVSDQNSNWDINESRFDVIRVSKYDSATGTYDLILGGRAEDISLAAEDSASYTDQTTVMGRTTGHVSHGIYEKIKFVDSNYKTSTIWAKQLNSHKGYIEGVTTLLIEESDMRPWWFNETEFFHNGNSRVVAFADGLGLDSDASILKLSDTAFFGFNDNDGSLYFRSSFGHMGRDYINTDVVWDHNFRNFVVAGGSSSHSPGKDGVLFRGDKEGFGQGVYHTDASTSNAYYYDSAPIYVSDWTWPNVTKDSNPAAPDSILDANDYNPSMITSSYNSLEYNGSYGANGLFTGFLGIVDKSDLQSFLNTEEYKENVANGIRVHRANDLFQIHQVSTVGDATADDGNVFMYDVIKSTDGEYYYLAGQVSGMLAKQNTGLSGVYDYFLGQWDIASEQFRFWQNGTEDDEEIYALTELRGTSKAVTNPEAENNGAGKGTVSWTPSTSGSYFYQCGNHGVMNGSLNVTVGVGGNTYNIEVLYTNAPGAFRFSGSDRNGAINSSTDNPTLTIQTNDTIVFTVNNVGHPFWIQTETGTGGAKKGHIAFCGRTTGQLGDPADTPTFGGYDLFLGIFDPRNWNAEYYNMGSGYNDKAMNLHDIDSTIPNTLALVYTTFGSMNGGPTFGSEDIGIITFNYDTDDWSEGFTTGSETSEEIDQNGKPSTRLADGRIAVVANSSGAFADNSVTFGLKDMVLGIFDFDSDTLNGGYKGWRKYQVGSGSSDFSYSVDNNGSSLLITGYSEATWDKEVHGVIVEFDPERNVLAKSSGS